MKDQINPRSPVVEILYWAEEGKGSTVFRVTRHLLLHSNRRPHVIHHRSKSGTVAKGSYWGTAGWTSAWRWNLVLSIKNMHRKRETQYFKPLQKIVWSQLQAETQQIRLSKFPTMVSKFPSKCCGPWNWWLSLLQSNMPQAEHREKKIFSIDRVDDAKELYHCNCRFIGLAFWSGTRTTGYIKSLNCFTDVWVFEHFIHGKIVLMY